MAQCKNCHAPLYLPETTRFCPICGHDQRAQSETGTLLSGQEKIPTQPLPNLNDDNQTPPAPSDTETFLADFEKNMPTQLSSPSLPETPFDEAAPTLASNQTLTDDP